jgi:hypothetical protein
MDFRCGRSSHQHDFEVWKELSEDAECLGMTSVVPSAIKKKFGFSPLCLAQQSTPAAKAGEF